MMKVSKAISQTTYLGGVVLVSAFVIVCGVVTVRAQKSLGPVDVHVVNPVLAVKDVDRGPVVPYRVVEATDFSQTAFTAYCCFGDAVPAGKRLVVEFVTAFCTVPAGQSVYVSLGAGPEGVGTNETIIWPTLTHQGVYGGNTVWNANHQVKAYLPEGSRFGASISRNGSGGFAQCRFHITGQLLPAED